MNRKIIISLSVLILVIAAGIFYAVAPEKTCFISDATCPFEAHVGRVQDSALSEDQFTRDFIGIFIIQAPNKDLLQKCYTQMWHFGDNSTAEYRSICRDNWGTYLSNPFIAETAHTYEKPGTYSVFIEIVAGVVENSSSPLTKPILATSQPFTVTILEDVVSSQ